MTLIQTTAMFANDAFGCDPNCRNHDTANGDGLCKSLDNVAAVVSKP